MTRWPIAWANEKSRIVPREFSLFGMGLRGDWFKVATCAASTAIWIATCGRPDVADVKKLQRVPSPLRPEKKKTKLMQQRKKKERTVSFSVSNHNDIIVLQRPIRTPPHLSGVSSRLPSKQCQCLSGWTQIVLDLGGWNVGRFLSPLLFPSGDECCDALACPCSGSSSSLWAPLSCQAADQM